MAKLLKDALLHSTAGQKVLAEIKCQKRDRLDTLQTVIEGTFAPSLTRLQRVRDKARYLAEKGGKEFDEFVLGLKHAKVSEVDWDIAVHSLLS